MVRIMSAVVAAVVLTTWPAFALEHPALPSASEGFDPSGYLGQGNAYNCADFASQANAQAVLRADPSDPNGLDRDKDGIACETSKGARDVVRVPR